MMRALPPWILAPALGILRPRPALAQCAMCNSAADASRAGTAFSISVLFLLATLLLAVGGLVFLAARRARGHPEAPGSRGAPGSGQGSPGPPPPVS